MSEILEYLLNDLLTLKTEEGAQLVDTPEKWFQKRAKIRQRILEIIGEFPSVCPPLDVEVLEESEQDAEASTKLRFLGLYPAEDFI